MNYITIENNIITGVHCANDQNTIKNAYPRATVKQVDDNFTGLSGDSILLFDADMKRKPLSVLVTSGLITLPKNKKLVGENIVDKNLQEQFDDESFTPPDGYTVVNNEIVPASVELLKDLKHAEMTRMFDDAIINGSFKSKTLGIDVDCRRGGRNNDYQNCIGLLSIMQRNGIAQIDYVGASSVTVKATQDQIQALIHEMEDHVQLLYKKKWMKKAMVDAAITKEEVNAVTW